MTENDDDSGFEQADVWIRTLPRLLTLAHAAYQNRYGRLPETDDELAEAVQMAVGEKDAG